jgi:two-component sensor histidine kinase
LQLIVILALLPVMLVSLFQGVARARMDIANVRERLVQSASTVAGGDQNLLAAAEQILRAAGSLSQVRDMSGDCDGVLSDMLVGVRFFSNLTRIDARGNIVCSAMALSKGVNVDDRDVFREARASTAMAVSHELVSRVTGKPVIAAMLALHKPDGGFNGVVTITLDIHWLDYMIGAANLPQGAVAAVYDTRGKLIATNNPTVGRAIAAQAAMGAGIQRTGRDQTGSVTDADGTSWRYGNAALIGNTIFVAFAMQSSDLFGPTYLHVGLDFLLPFLMIGFAWFAISMAADHQVNRWLVHLSRIAAAYRGGHYSIRPDLAQASVEFRQLGDTMGDMAGAIEDRDRRLRDAVNVKSLLIREVHHRVKNNLQIVMSLLSIQANQIKDASARDALTQAQMRINALALAHRILNEMENQSILDIRLLLEELVDQIVGGMGGENVRITMDLENRNMPGNVAVALALFTVEALTNIFKHAFPDGGEGAIRIGLGPTAGGKLKLVIADDGVGFSMAAAGKNVGSRLIKTFGLQLGGVSTVRSEPGQGTVVELVFPNPGIQA